MRKVAKRVPQVRQRIREARGGECTGAVAGGAQAWRMSCEGVAKDAPQPVQAGGRAKTGEEAEAAAGRAVEANANEGASCATGATGDGSATVAVAAMAVVAVVWRATSRVLSGEAEVEVSVFATPYMYSMRSEPESHRPDGGNGFENQIGVSDSKRRGKFNLTQKPDWFYGRLQDRADKV